MSQQELDQHSAKEEVFENPSMEAEEEYSHSKHLRVLNYGNGVYTISLMDNETQDREQPTLDNLQAYNELGPDAIARGLAKIHSLDLQIYNLMHIRGNGKTIGLIVLTSPGH